MAYNLTQEQKDELKEIFDIEDIDGDGWVNKVQLGKILRSFGQHPTDEEVEKHYRNYDPDEDEGIQYDDVLDVVSKS